MDFDVLDTLLAPLDGLHMRADTRLIHVPGFARVEAPSAPESWRNEVYHCALTTDADRVIDETFARYAELGTPFKWSVGPGSAPADLAERLGARGRSWTVQAFGCQTTGWTITCPDDVTVERVTAETLPEFVQGNATGWDHQTPFVDRLLADLQWSLETGTHRMFLARIDGEPVGMSAWVPRHRGPGYLSGGMVLPAFRGRGVYRALIQARFDDMAALGQGRAVTLSRAHTSGPILSGLGLTPLFRYPIFELPAPGDSG